MIAIPMKRLTKLTTAEYQRLTEDATALKSRGDQPTILLTKDNTVIKHMFHDEYAHKNKWMYKLKPPAVCFQKNAEHLSQLGIPTVTVSELYDYPELNCHLVFYNFLKGKSILSLLREGDYSSLAQLPTFIAKLHKLGIHYRDLNMDNVILQDDGSFALIDVRPIEIQRKALSVRRCARTFANLLNYEEDREALEHFGIERFINLYLKIVDFSTQQGDRFFYYLNKQLKTKTFPIPEVISQKGGKC